MIKEEAVRKNSVISDKLTTSEEKKASCTVQFVFTCSLCNIDQQLLKEKVLLGQVVSLLKSAYTVSQPAAPVHIKDSLLQHVLEVQVK